MINDVIRICKTYAENKGFSGVISVRGVEGVLFEEAYGFRNRAERLHNETSTAFGIASGTKLLTGLAACKLIDDKKLGLADNVWDILPYDLGKIDTEVTLYHLLTHTSGIGDYIDEESPHSESDMVDLYAKYPVYLWTGLSYYLPMIVDLPAKYKPGERYGYSNAGFVLLGLVIEAVSGIRYQDYITQNIIKPCGLIHTGFYRMDRLPFNTAYGYIYDAIADEWYANIFNMPIIGGSDGGLFTCATDLVKLWNAVFAGNIMSDAMRSEWLMPQIIRGNDDRYSYGLGVYQYHAPETDAYYAVGGDFGVDFFTTFFPKYEIVASALGNTQMNTWPLLYQLLNVI